MLKIYNLICLFCHVNHFYLYNSVVFSQWCSSSTEHFRPAKLKLCIQQTTLHPLLLPRSCNHHSFFVSVNASRKWNPTYLSFL